MPTLSSVIELPSPCLVVLVGPAGAGKSTWAVEHLPGMVVSSDDLRAVVGEGQHDLRASADAFQLVDEIVERRLRRGLTTVIDSLGTDAGRRDHWRSIAARHAVPCVAVVFDLPAAQVRRQNRSRSPRVPDAVVNAQLKEWSHTLAEVDDEPFAAVHRAEPAAVVPSELRRSPQRVLPPSESGSEREGTRSATGRSLRFGLYVPVISWAEGSSVVGSRLRETAQLAERVGFDGVWMMDHVRQIPMHGPPWSDILESWTALAHIAGCTARIRVGTLVTAVTFRNVAHLAKIIASLDVLSGGRVDCGIGLGWLKDEHEGYGWRFPDVDERYALLEDALQLLPRMWGPGSKPFEGTALRVPDTSCYPRPLQKHVPIMVGGSGERRTLRLVAKYADACNLFGDVATVSRKLDVLRRHCADVERDPDEVSVSHLSNVLVGDGAEHLRGLVDRTRPPRVSAERHARTVNAGTVEQHVDRVRRYAAVGVDHVIVSLADLTSPVAAAGPVPSPSAVEMYGRVIDACRSVPESAGRVW
jgi:F420-dependent oxidoreductase-like protein